MGNNGTITTQADIMQGSHNPSIGKSNTLYFIRKHSLVKLVVKSEG